MNQNNNIDQQSFKSFTYGEFIDGEENKNINQPKQDQCSVNEDQRLSNFSTDAQPQFQRQCNSNISQFNRFSKLSEGV